MLTQDEIKQKLGQYAVSLVPPDTTIGMGTGTTIYWLIRELGSRVKQGFMVNIVPTSTQTRQLAEQAGIGVVELNDVDSLPLTIDGADEIDPKFQLIKGGGGALLQEKMVAAASDQLVILADESKHVEELGLFPLPVEVIRSGWKQVEKKIRLTGCKQASLRKKGDEFFITDNGHYILDCHFEKILHPFELNSQIHLIPGVVDTGLFVDMATTVILGFADGRIEVNNRS